MPESIAMSSVLKSSLTTAELTVYVGAFTKSRRLGMSTYMSSKHAFQVLKEHRAKCVVVKSDIALSAVPSTFIKEEDKRQVFGFFSVVEKDGAPLVDTQGDVISEEEIEKAAYDYVRNSGMGDERHDGRCKAILIESMVFTKEKQRLLNIDLGYVGWWGGFYVTDDEMWQKVKSGEYAMFSIGGVGVHEPI